MKKELMIFSVIFVVLTLAMHYEEWFSHPFLHLKQLASSGAYGIGAVHPIVFTLIVYTLFWIPRGVLKLLKRIKKGS